MRLFTFSTCLLVLFSLTMWQVRVQADAIYRLCGERFKKVWENCCGHKCGHPLKRTLGKKHTIIRVFYILWELSAILIGLN